MNTIQAGDRVTVTRHLPDGRTARWTGTTSELLHENGAVTGFRLNGTGPDGWSCDTYLDANAEQMLRLYGVRQTIEPA